MLHEIVHLTLEALNYRHVMKQTSVPQAYAGRIAFGVFERSQQYTLERQRFSITARFAQIPFFWFLIFRNGFNVFDYYAALWAGYGTLSHSVLFCVFVAIYFGIIALPFKIYSIFVIEEKYGFNKMNFSLFIVDFFKSLIIAVLIGLPLLYLVFWFMRESGPVWWLCVWGSVSAFQFVMVAVYPRFLAPLFNKFTELKDDELSTAIRRLAEKIDFKMSGVYVMDGSKRSGHSNAYFAGMGRFRRIVLFDTLIKKLEAVELLTVLAHEMGHNVKKHTRNFMILSLILSFIGFYFLSVLMTWPEFYHAFNVAVPSSHAAIVIFAAASEVFTFALTPALNFISRRHEYQADAFSVQHAGNKEAFISSLFKLTADNLSNLMPHPWYSFYHYSHPTTAERVAAIEHGDESLGG